MADDVATVTVDDLFADRQTKAAAVGFAKAGEGFKDLAYEMFRYAWAVITEAEV